MRNHDGPELFREADDVGGGRLHEPFAGGDVEGHPQVAADDGSVADGDAAEHGGVGIDHHVVAHDRMSGHSFYGIVVGVAHERACAESDALIYFHVVANY